MIREEEGSALVLAMTTIVVLSILTLGISNSIVNKARLMSMEEKGMQAFYMAEAGVEKTMHKINNNINSNLFDPVTDLIDSTPNSLKDGEYKVSNVIDVTSSNNSTVKEYQVTVIGRSGDAEKVITTTVRYSTILSHTVVSGGKVHNKIEKDLGWPFGTKTFGKIEIEDNDKVEDADVPDFVFSTDHYGISEADHNPDNMQDKRYFKSGEFLNNSANPWYIKDELFDGKIGADINLLGGETFYHEGDLDLGIADIYGGYDGTGQLPDKEDNIEPTVIVVDGNLNFPDVYTHIHNVYFIVNGNVNISGARLETENTFIYAKDNMNFEYANLSIFNSVSGFTYNGALMSGGDLTANVASLGSVIGGLFGADITTGTINSDDNLKLQYIFNSLEDNDKTNLKPVLISWQEKKIISNKK